MDRIPGEHLEFSKYLDSNECKFDNAYDAGTPTAPRSGNITMSLTGAVPGGSTKMYHQDGSAFTIANPVKLVKNYDDLEISDTEINVFLFVYNTDPEDSDSPYIEIYLGQVVSIVAGA